MVARPEPGCGSILTASWYSCSSPTSGIRTATRRSKPWPEPTGRWPAADSPCAARHSRRGAFVPGESKKPLVAVSGQSFDLAHEPRLDSFRVLDYDLLPQRAVLQQDAGAGPVV